MQFATNGNDERFEAGPEAPKVAKCPECGYPVTLRGRKQFGRNGRAYSGEARYRALLASRTL